MEMPEALRQLKDSLSKYSKSQLLHLSEAAEILHVTEGHLANLMKQGKVRGFRVGEYWFMEESWVDDFRSLVKKSLAREMESLKSSMPHGHGWSRPLNPRRYPKLKLRASRILSPFLILARIAATPALILKSILSGLKRKARNRSRKRADAALRRTLLKKMKVKKRRRCAKTDIIGKLIAAVACFGDRIRQAMADYLIYAGRTIRSAFKVAAAAVFLVALATAFSLMSLPLARVGLDRADIAASFLNVTYRAYGLPSASLRSLAFDRRIDDEALTRAIYRLVGKNPPGQVAGVFEVSIR